MKTLYSKERAKGLTLKAEREIQSLIAELYYLYQLYHLYQLINFQANPLTYFF